MLIFNVILQRVNFITFIARLWPGVWDCGYMLLNQTIPDNCVLLNFCETFVSVFYANLQKAHKNFITFIARQ